MTKLLLRILRWYYGRFYKIRFDTDYSYQMLEYYTLPPLERHHKYLIEDGWEKVTGIDTRCMSYRVWYRKRKPWLES